MIRYKIWIGNNAKCLRLWLNHLIMFQLCTFDWCWFDLFIRTNIHNNKKTNWPPKAASSSPSEGLCWYCCLLGMWGHLLKMFTRSNFVRELILHFSTVAEGKKKCLMCEGQNCCIILWYFLSFSLQSGLISLKFDMLSGREAAIVNVVYKSDGLVRFSHFWHHEIVLKMAWSTAPQLYSNFCLQNLEFKFLYNAKLNFRFLTDLK